MACGHGLLQVDKTVEYVTKHHAAMEADVNFAITVSVREGVRGSGVYLREPWEVDREAAEVTVFVKPEFHEDAPKQKQIDFGWG